MSILEKISPMESFVRTESNNRTIERVYSNISIEKKKQLEIIIDITKEDLKLVKGELSTKRLQELLESLESQYKAHYFKRIVKYHEDEDNSNKIYTIINVPLTDEEILNPESVITQMKSEALKIQKINEATHNRNAERLNGGR